MTNSINELKSYTEYNVSTPTSVFTIGFQYEYNVDHVNVYVNDVEATAAGYTVQHDSHGTISLTPAVPSGIVRVSRETDIDTSAHTFSAGAKFTAGNMDENFQQIRHSQQEVRDGFEKLSDDTYEIIDTLQVVGQAAQGAADAAEQAAQAANDAAAQVNDKVSYTDLSNAIAATPHNNLTDRDATGAHPASAIKNSNGEDQQQINDSLIRSVSNKTDLLTINNPRNKQVVYVTENEKRYIYNSNLTSDDNGVTIVGKWEMETQEAYYASWFCQSESGVDESIKLQAGYDYATSKKRAFIVDVKVDVNPTNLTKTALWIRSNSVLGFVGDGEMRMLANSATNYDLIRAQDVENYIIKNPVLRGDRLTHTGTGGEWGYGLTIYQSKNGYIHRPRIYNMWGDGIYIGKSWGETSDSVPTNVTVFEPYIEGVRRNGLSFTAGNNVHVIRPYITKVGDYDGVTGAFPKAGIDVEPEAAPNTPATYMRHCSIEAPSILDCHVGFFVYVFPDNIEIDLHIKGTTTITRCITNAFGLFHGGSNCTGLVQIDHVHITTAPLVAVPHAWSSDSKLFANVDRITTDDTVVSNMIFAVLLNGAFVAKKLGNLTFNNIKSNSAFMPVAYDAANLNGYTDNTRYLCAEDSKSKLTIYKGTGTLPKFGKDAYIDSSYMHLGFSIYTNELPNNIWLDPLSDLTIPIYVVSIGDYRTLKVGLRNESANIGQGVHINGLNLLNEDGLVKTEAHCKTLGGWIKFRNVNRGRTQILDSYGAWTFS